MNKNSNSHLTEAILFLVIFLIVTILTSYWIGFFTLNTPAILIVSLALSILIYKKFPVEPEKIPWQVIACSAIVIFISAVPLMLIHPEYMASNDALHTITTRVLVQQDKIPVSYQPYSEISFTYPIGFHLLAKHAIELIPSIPDHQVLWLLGLLFVGLEPLLLYLFASKLLGSEKSGIFSAAILIGTKVLFQNMFYGMFPRLLFTCLFFAFGWLFLKNKKIAWIFLPAMLLVHPVMLINFAVFMAVFLAFHPEKIMPFAKSLPSFLAGLPAIITNYILYAGNLLRGFQGKTIHLVESTVQGNLLTALIASIPWMGWLNAALFFPLAAYTIIRKKIRQKEKFLLSLVVVSWILFVVLEGSGQMFGNVAIWLFSLGAVLFNALVLSKIKAISKLEKHVFLLIVVLGISMLFLSSDFNSRITGSKLTPEEAEFAFAFRELDPELKPTLLLTPHSAKIAEYSNKMPFDVTRSWFLPVSPIELRQDQTWLDAIEKHRQFTELKESGCTECIEKLDVEYIVVDSDYFEHSVPGTIVLEKGNLKAFRRGQT